MSFDWYDGLVVRRRSGATDYKSVVQNNRWCVLICRAPAFLSPHPMRLRRVVLLDRDFFSVCELWCDAPRRNSRRGASGHNECGFAASFNLASYSRLLAE